MSGWRSDKLTLADGSKKADKINKILADVKSKASDGATVSEISNLFVGSLRANGIPARVVVGLLTEASKTTNHTWVEAYIAGLGWTTAETKNRTVNTADARYVALAVRSASSSSPTPNFADTKLEYKPGHSLPINDLKPTISSKTYLFLPGLGLRVTSVQLPVGVVTDNAAILIVGDRTTPLGSLAPAQKVTSRDPLFGSKAHKKYRVEYIILEDDSSTSEDTGAVGRQAQAVSTVSWLPFIILCVVLTIAISTSVIWIKKDRLAKLKTLKVFGRNQTDQSVIEPVAPVLPSKPPIVAKTATIPKKPATKKPTTLIQ